MQDLEVQAPATAAPAGGAPTGSIALSDLEAPFAWLTHGASAGGAAPHAGDAAAMPGAALIFAAVAVGLVVRRIMAGADARSAEAPEARSLGTEVATARRLSDLDAAAAEAAFKQRYARVR